jgi:hypothetical protein
MYFNKAVLNLMKKRVLLYVLKIHKIKNYNKNVELTKMIKQDHFIFIMKAVSKINLLLFQNIYLINLKENFKNINNFVKIKYNKYRVDFNQDNVIKPKF